MLSVPIIAVVLRKQIGASELNLSSHDLLERLVGIANDVIDHHEKRRPSHARLAMKVQPSVGRQLLDEADKFIYDMLIGSAHVGGGETDVIKAGLRCRVAFGPDVFDLNFQRLEQFFVTVAERRKRLTSADDRLKTFELIAFDVSAGDHARIGSIVLLVPTDGDAVRKSMRLLTQIDHVKSKSARKFFDQSVEVGRLSTCRRMQLIVDAEIPQLIRAVQTPLRACRRRHQ